MINLTWNVCKGYGGDDLVLVKGGVKISTRNYHLLP